MPIAILHRLGALAALALAAGPAAAQFAAAPLPPGLGDLGYMTAPALLDADGDGDLDVFAGLANGTIAYYENTGSATAPAFTPRTGGANPLTGVGFVAAAGVTTGDLDGDGDLDLVGGGMMGTVLPQRNTGTPQTPVFAAFPGLTLPEQGRNALPALADVDGDGDLDYLAGTSLGTLLYAENTGSRAAPAFTLRTGTANPFASFDVGFSAAPAVFDIDGDGDLDLLVGNVDGVLALALNTGGPSGPSAFGPLADATARGLTDVGYGAVPTAGDLDGDGDLDVLVGRSDGTFAYFANQTAALRVTLAGPEGFRELASPVPGAFLNDLLSSIHTQGMPGADYPEGGPSVLAYNEAVPGSLDDGFAAPATLAAPAGAGRGYAVYVYTDDDPTTPGPQGGFPKTLDVSPGPMVTQPFTWTGAALTYTPSGSAPDDGWNLLGNPFVGWMDWDATTSTGLNAAAYVLDGTTASYFAYSRGVGGTLPGGVIGPFTAFWVHANAANPVLVATPSPSSGGPVYGRSAAGPRLALRLAPEAGGPLPASLQSNALLALDVPEAQPGVSPLDAVALLPTAPTYVLVGTRALRADGSLAALSVDARPALDGPVEIDLEVTAVSPLSTDARFVLSWPRLENVPDDVPLTLLDRLTGTETDLRLADRYAFSMSLTAGRAAAGPAVSRAAGSARFALAVGGRPVAGAQALPTLLALSPPHPNPTSGAARLDLSLPAAASVRVVVMDALGRLVSVLSDAERPAGRHGLDVPTGLAPGLYAIQAEVQEGNTRTVLTQRVVVTR